MRTCLELDGRHPNAELGIYPDQTSYRAHTCQFMLQSVEGAKHTCSACLLPIPERLFQLSIGRSRKQRQRDQLCSFIGLGLPDCLQALCHVRIDVVESAKLDRGAKERICRQWRTDRKA